jgi:hypothetical protein
MKVSLDFLSSDEGMRLGLANRLHEEEKHDSQNLKSAVASSKPPELLFFHHSYP